MTDEEGKPWWGYILLIERQESRNFQGEDRQEGNYYYLGVAGRQFKTHPAESTALVTSFPSQIDVLHIDHNWTGT